MKTKIKDLTTEQIIKICDTHSCDNCPLKVPTVNACKNWDGFFEKHKEEEVETDD